MLHQESAALHGKRGLLLSSVPDGVLSVSRPRFDSIDELIAAQDARAEEKAEFSRLVWEEFSAQGGVVLKTRPSMGITRVSLTHSTYPGVPYQVTRWDGAEPTGHVDAMSPELAVEELWYWAGMDGWRERWENRPSDIVPNPDPDADPFDAEPPAAMVVAAASFLRYYVTPELPCSSDDHPRDRRRARSRAQMGDEEQIDLQVDVALEAWGVWAGRAFNRALEQLGLDEPIE